jgi:hypothetical protein
MRLRVLLTCGVMAIYGCGASTTTPDGGQFDAGPSGTDTGLDDAGSADAGTTDTGTPDAGTTDAGVADLEVGDGVAWRHEQLAGLSVDTYTWSDSTGHPRTVSLKRQGEGNPGNGGYAVHLTYEVAASGGTTRTVTVTGTQGGESGFGFFVGHELTRDFGNGDSGTIAGLHGEDDSPLGLDFAVAASRTTLSATSTVATHTFTSTYPKWGTAAPMADVTAQTTTTLSAHQKFLLPVTLRWVFEKGTDFPRLDVQVDLSNETAGQLAFDVRGPYGTLEFADGDPDATLNNVQWGDSAFVFTTLAPAQGDLTTQAGWSWNEPIGTTRKHHALLARHSQSGVLYEIGLVEMPAAGETGLTYGTWADNRGTTSAASGHALLSAAFDGWQWPFQSAQYSGLSPTAPSTFKKFAWGSSNLYGSANDTQWLNDTVSVPIAARPARLTYRVCLVLGVSNYDDTTHESLTRAVAKSGSPSCAAEAWLP